MPLNTPIAREGYPFIVAGALVTLLLAMLPWKLPALLFFFVTLFVVWFFRNPERTCEDRDEALVSPADGTVVYIGKAFNERMQAETMKVSIFMSVFNVHVNRAPVSGKIVDKYYVKGKFLDVRDERATFENEQNALVLETAGGARIGVVQVAGLIARRIVCYPGVGDTLARGERYGLIRFGSRLDIYLPPDTQVCVALGDKTAAGRTVIGYLH